MSVEGLAPLLVDALSDSFGVEFGAGDGLRCALLRLSFLSLPAAWLFWRASPRLQGDLEL